jgi:hypothetical protein
MERNYAKKVILRKIAMFMFVVAPGIAHPQQARTFVTCMSHPSLQTAPFKPRRLEWAIRPFERSNDGIDSVDER